MNQIEDSIRRVAGDLMNSKYSIALTGAGMSTESGVPDFRGRWNLDQRSGSGKKSISNIFQIRIRSWRILEGQDQQPFSVG